MNAIKTVLFVEDSSGDVRLTQEVFRKINSYVKLHVAKGINDFCLTQVNLPPQVHR
jgi:hypothetical protein